MTIKQIKKLALASYTRNVLDSKKVNRISRMLTRSELKIYLKMLRMVEKSKTLIVFLPNLSYISLLTKKIKQLFPNKKILFKKDESLITGVKIVNNDNVYDFNLRNRLENLVLYINK